MTNKISPLDKLMAQHAVYQDYKLEREKDKKWQVISVRIRPPLLEPVADALDEVSATELITFALAEYFGLNLEDVARGGK